MKRTALLIPFVCFFAYSAFSQLKLVEKVEKKGNEIVIPYEKYIMPNGLTVILHEDHSDPVVRVDITYHVGSAREEIGKSGFAHFFEHMLFQGSDNVADEQHLKLVTDAGGTANGSTNRDRTNYYQTVPANQLEKILWLEADRMGFFLDAVTQKKFEVQRSTVKNERGQRYDNVPYGNVAEFSAKNIYPYGHPYSWLTIGYVEDLNRVDVNDLKNFFLRWYGPNNAVLTVGGDINKAQVIKWVEKYFGSIKKGPDVAPTRLPLPVIESNRFVSYTDNYARLPLLSISYPAPPNYHSDIPSLECLAQVLGQGKNSMLYQYITKNQKAVNASGFLSPWELGSEVMFRITPTPGTSLKESWELYKAALDSFELKGGVTQDDIDRFKGTALSQLYSSLQSVSSKVSYLAQYATFTNTPNKLPEIIAGYNALTRESVMAAYNKYIKNKGAVVVSVLPKGQEKLIAAENNYKIDSANYKAPDYGYAGLRYEKGKDNFDRRKIPGAAGPVSVKVPKFWRADLANNIKVIGTENTEVPMVNIFISLPGGHIAQANNLSKAGLASFFAAMMSEDTKNYTAEQMGVAMQKLGSTVFINSDVNNFFVSIQALKENVAQTLALVEERLLNPKFTDAAFNRIKKQRLDFFRLAKSNPDQVADVAFAKLNYGHNHILGINQSGTEQTIAGITRQDIEDYYNNNFTVNGAKIVIVGDVKQEDILPRLRFLDKLPAKKVMLPELPQAKNDASTQVYLVDIPKSAQTAFRIGYATNLKYDYAGDFNKARLMNYPLGGDFNSRLNLNLREDKGWTYGAVSGFSGDEISGDFQFSSGIRSDATDSALVEIMKEIKNYFYNGITEEELKFMKNSIGQRDALSYETGFQKANFMSRILDYNLPANYAEIQNKQLASITKKQIDEIIKKYLKPDNMNILLAGDKTKIYEAVKKLGYKITELDTEGNVIPQQKGF